MRGAGFALGAWLVMAACGDSGAGDGAKKHADAGSGASHARRDAGAGTHEDAGKLVWHPDASLDSGFDDGTSRGGATPALDAGSPLAGRDCAKRRMPLPAVLLPRCRASTRDCVAACASADDADMCRSACLKADDMPADTSYGLDCQGCVFLQLFGCLDQGGCDDGVAEVFCCLEDKCPTGSADNCGDQMCGNEIRAAVTCGYYTKMECLDFLGGTIDQCFEGQGAGSDAGGGP
jgi:hypothetical protein